MSDAPLLSVRDLRVQFPVGGGRVVKAVDGVDFDLFSGETLGIVGESGSGKSTLGRALLRLVPTSSGRVTFDGEDFLALSAPRMRDARRDIQMVFQDPFASLSPRQTIAQLLSEPLEIHGLLPGRAERRAKAGELLESVGLPTSVLDRFPHEFSGGQRQRIGIARALALDPKVIVLDEPVSALDISVRAQVVNLLMDLQKARGISYVFIGHDLSLIRRIAHRIAVMYLGRIVELSPAEDLGSNPRHPYTRSLLDAAPVADPAKRRVRALLSGDPPSPIDLPTGCRFRTRCPFAIDACAQTDPALFAIDTDPAHKTACLRDKEIPGWSAAD